MALSSIRLARLKRDMRLYELARRIPISESKLSRIETGLDRAAPHVLGRIAHELGVTVESLNADEEEQRWLK